MCKCTIRVLNQYRWLVCSPRALQRFEEGGCTGPQTRQTSPVKPQSQTVPAMQTLLFSSYKRVYFIGCDVYRRSSRFLRLSVFFYLLLHVPECVYRIPLPEATNGCTHYYVQRLLLYLAALTPTDRQAAMNIFSWV